MFRSNIQCTQEPCRKKISPLIKHCDDTSIRIASVFGLPNWQYEYPEPVSTNKQLLYNFFNYTHERFWLWTLIIGGISAVWYSLDVIAKTTLNLARFFTEFLPLTLHELTDHLSNAALNKARDEQDISFNKVIFVAAYGLAKATSFASKLIHFIGRAITSPPEGVMAAAREGWTLGGPGPVGATLASIFASTSVLISVAVFIVLFPIKSAFSYETTVLPIIKYCPPVVAHIFYSAVKYIKPVFDAVGSMLSHIFYPVVSPIAKLLHDPLSKAVIGMGSYAGGLSVIIDMTITLYGVKLIKKATDGIFSLGKKLFSKMFGSVEPEKKTLENPPITPAVERATPDSFRLGSSALTISTLGKTPTPDTRDVRQASSSTQEPVQYRKNSNTMFADQNSVSVDEQREQEVTRSEPDMSEAMLRAAT